MSTLDKQDHQLLTALQQNARLSVAELGRRIGLSRTATLARIQRLESSGVIRGYHADIAPPQASADDTASPHTARIGLVVSTRDTPGYIRRLETMLGPQLREIESIAGEYDLLVGVVVVSANKLDEILNIISGWPETQRTTTFVVLNRADRGG